MIEGRSGRTIQADGDLVRTYRLSLGLTQKELAKLSGYSERLVLKLEAGEPVRFSTLEIIAETFREQGLELSTLDLSTSPVSVAKGFVRAYKFYEADFMVHAAHLIHPKIRIVVAGDPHVIPFAGQYDGHDGMDDFWKRFFGFLHRPKKDFFLPRYFSNGNEVAAFGQEIALIRGQQDGVEEKPSWIALRFVLKDGKVIEYHDYYDTQSATKYIEIFAGRSFAE